MKEFLDTNILVRYLTRDSPLLGTRAAALIERDVGLFITPHVLAEAAYVLIKVYGRDRSAVVDALTDLLQRENVQLHGLDTELGLEALALCRPSGRVSFADALLWAEARSSTPSRIWSFDRRFPHLGVELREPGI